MDENGDDKDDTKRRTRNLSEKKRRDQFNMLVNELGTMVSTNNRKMDKSTILKSTISFLKNHNELTVRSRAHDINEEWKPAFLSNEEFTYLLLEAHEGFLMVFSATGRIFYVSETIISLLGHNPADVVNKSIFDLAYEDDRPRLYSMLQNPGPAVEPNQIVTADNEIKFQCHIQRGAFDIGDEVSYELVQFNGHFRTSMESIDSDDLSSYGDQETRLLFVCTGKLYIPQLIRDVSLLDSNRNEFTSRHSLEWKFLFLDHRAPPIIGYLPFEVLGTSGYDYYHFDDLEKVTTCHEALMQKGQMTSCYYRFLTKGQQWIWLQTRYYITYHQWNSKPEFVVCTHRVVSYADISKSTKQEDAEADTASEVEVNSSVMKEASAEETNIVEASPSYMSEASDAFGSYQPMSQADSGIYTPYTPHGSYGLQHFENDMIGGTSGRYSGHGSEVGMVVYPIKGPMPEPALVPQHGVGVQYLEPAPYIRAVSGVLPLQLQPIHAVPAIVSSDQAQIQEQLQRKHEELQEMIMRQQEELRQVKEQLLLARLGILQPLVNVPNSYTNPEEVQQNPNVPAPIDYDGAQPRPGPGYLPQPPNSSDHHPHMPQ